MLPCVADNAHDPLSSRLTNHFRDTNQQTAGDYGAPFRVVMIPWNVLAEVADVVVKPVEAAKDASDGIAHAVLAGIEVFRK
jgi:hypothetical protein